MSWFARLFGDPGSHSAGSSSQRDDSRERIAELEARCGELAEQLHRCDERLRERSEVLYELQQHYSSEHFELSESMRNLKIERLRNAGMFADRDIILQRAKDLQERIRELKERLSKYEAVEDHLFDTAAIVIEEDPHPSGA